MKTWSCILLACVSIMFIACSGSPHNGATMHFKNVEGVPLSKLVPGQTAYISLESILVDDQLRAYIDTSKTMLAEPPKESLVKEKNTGFALVYKSNDGDYYVAVYGTKALKMNFKNSPNIMPVKAIVFKETTSAEEVLTDAADMCKLFGIENSKG